MLTLVRTYLYLLYNFYNTGFAAFVILQHRSAVFKICVHTWIRTHGTSVFDSVMSVLTFMHTDLDPASDETTVGGALARVSAFRVGLDVSRRVSLSLKRVYL